MSALRLATQSDTDAETLGRLMVGAFPQMFVRIPGPSRLVHARAVGFALRGFGAMSKVWFAEAGGAPVGFILMRWGNRETPLHALRALVAMLRELGFWRTLWVALRVPPPPPRWLHPGEAYLSAIGVVPDQRGQGVGAVLLRHAIAQARQRGYRRLSLRVEAANAAAIRFYRRHGFHAVRGDWDWLFHALRRDFGQVFMTYAIDAPGPAAERSGAPALKAGP